MQIHEQSLNITTQSQQALRKRLRSLWFAVMKADQSTFEFIQHSFNSRSQSRAELTVDLFDDDGWYDVDNDCYTDDSSLYYSLKKLKKSAAVISAQYFSCSFDLFYNSSLHQINEYNNDEITWSTSEKLAYLVRIKVLLLWNVTFLLKHLFLENTLWWTGQF